MLYFVKNYKNLFLASIRSEFGRFAHEAGAWQENHDIKVDSNWSKLDENFQKLVQDWKIDEKDLKTITEIQEEMKNLESETKTKLQEYLKTMTDSVLVKWFKVNWKDGFDALKRIAELTWDTELIRDLDWMEYTALDWKSIAKITTEHKLINQFKWFDVYDQDWDRIWYLKNWKIEKHIYNNFYNDNSTENDNQINLSIPKIDTDIDSILEQAKKNEKKPNRLDQITDEYTNKIEDIDTLEALIIELENLAAPYKVEKNTEKLEEIKEKILTINKRIEQLEKANVNQSVDKDPAIANPIETQTPEQTKLDLIKSLVENNPNLSIEDWKVYFTHVTPDWKTHRWFFTIEKNPDIKDEATLKTWTEEMGKKLDKKYPKIEKKIEKEAEKDNVITEEKETTETIEISYNLYSDDIIKNAISNLEHNWWINQEQIIWTYTHNWKTENIVLQTWRDSKYSVELKGTWFINDLDLDSTDQTNIWTEWPTVDTLISWEVQNIKIAVEKLIKIYQSNEQKLSSEKDEEQAKEQKERDNSYPKIINLNERNINWENIILKLEKQNRKEVEAVPWTYVWEDKFTLKIDNDWYTWKSFSVDIKPENWESPSISEIDKAQKKLLEEYSNYVEQELKQKEEKLLEEENEKLIDKIKETLENIKLSAKEIKPDWVDENKWIKWIWEFSSSDLPNINLNINSVDLKDNKINIDFNDSWLNELFNKWLVLEWILNEEWEIDINKFNQEIKKAVENAINNMIKQEEENK